jgi:outer membrane immunogenic protein
MKKLLVGLLGAAMIPFAAHAQDTTAPDGTTAFGFEPYVGVMGGYHEFDSDNRGQLTSNCGSGGCPDGGFIEGVVGANIPLGAFFVGAEGNAAKGFRGLDWEYGVWGRAGFRAGETGLIFGKVGYQWVNTDEPQGDDDDWAYGLGVEVGPEMIGMGGLTGMSGLRLRLEASTFDFQSIRPSAGVILHF